jgi:hypothetical protein
MWIASRAAMSSDYQQTPELFFPFFFFFSFFETYPPDSYFRPIIQAEYFGPSGKRHVAVVYRTVAGRIPYTLEFAIFVAFVSKI